MEQIQKTTVWNKILSAGNNALFWIPVIVLCWPVLLAEKFVYRKNQDNRPMHKAHLNGLSEGVNCALAMAMVYIVFAMALFFN